MGQSRLFSRRGAAGVLAMVLYVLAHQPLHEAVGDSAKIFSTLPVVVIAWLFGIRGGLVGVVVAIAINVVLVATMTPEDLGGWLVGGGGLGSAALLGVGAMVGWLSDLSRRANTELDRRRELEARILNARDELEQRVEDQTAVLRRRETQAHAAAEEDAAMAELGRVISSSRGVKEVYERFAELVNALVPWDRMLIGKIDESRGTIDNQSLIGAYAEGLPPRHTWPLAGTPAIQAIRRRSPQMVSMQDETYIAKTFPGLLPAYHAGIRTSIASPLISNDAPIGVLLIQSFEIDAYTERDLLIVSRVGDQIAGAVANDQLKVELKAESTEREALAEIGRIISSSLEIDDVYERFVEKMGQLIPSDSVFVNLVDWQLETYTTEYEVGSPVPAWGKSRQRPLEGSLTGLVARSRTPHLVTMEDRTDGEAGLPGVDSMLRAGFSSILGVPLIAADTVRGVLILNAKRPGSYNDRHRALAERIADQVAGAIANSVLYRDRQRAEGELRKSEADNRALIDAIPDLMFRIREDGVIIDYIISEDGTGLALQPEEFLGKRIRDVMSPAFADLVMSYVSQALDTRTGQVFEYQLPVPLGSDNVRDFEARVHVSGDDEVLAIVRDITGRKRAEKKIADSQGQLLAVLDSVGEGIVVVDTTGVILMVNRETLAICGYENEQIVGQNLSVLMPEKYRRSLTRWLRQHTDPGRYPAPSNRIEMQGLRMDGTVFPLEYTVAKTHIGDRQIFVGAVRDISRRKHRESEISRLVRHNDLILDSAGEGICGLDLEGNITFINPAGADMAGWEVQEMIGRSLHELVHHSKPDGAPYPPGECPIRLPTRNGRTPRVVDEVFLKKDGTDFPVEYVKTPIVDERGALDGTVVTFRDVTDRRQLQRQVVHSQKMDAIGRLADGLAHDFNNVLMAIIGHAELAGMRLPPGHSLHE